MALVLTVLGFLWWWPLGLILLGFMIARGRRACWRRQIAGDGSMLGWERGGDRWDRKVARMQEKMERLRARMGRGDGFGPASSGNRAFDEYRSETLKRLEDEQREFKEFLARLRIAKDRAEFDHFMTDRRQRPSDPNSQTEPSPTEPRD